MLLLRLVLSLAGLRSVIYMSNWGKRVDLNRSMGSAEGEDGYVLRDCAQGVLLLASYEIGCLSNFNVLGLAGSL